MKILKEIFKRISITIIIIYLLLSLICNEKISYATDVVSQEQAGVIIGTFAINYYNSPNKDQSVYATTNRERSYQGEQTGGKWPYDCVGWVSFAIHQATGIGNSTFTYFGTPPFNRNPGYAKNNTRWNILLRNTRRLYKTIYSFNSRGIKNFKTWGFAFLEFRN